MSNSSSSAMLILFACIVLIAVLPVVESQWGYGYRRYGYGGYGGYPYGGYGMGMPFMGGMGGMGSMFPFFGKKK
uniref:Uncharacterized protein n=1 Tax=Ditylenchus dipsaci TaxID=166011 RepID=A0A915EG09_9BILA